MIKTLRDPPERHPAQILCESAGGKSARGKFIAARMAPVNDLRLRSIAP